MVVRWCYFLRDEKSYTEFIHVVKTQGIPLTNRGYHTDTHHVSKKVITVNSLI